MRRIDRLRLATAATALSLHAATATAQDQPTRFAADRPADIRHIRLDLAVDIEHRRVEGTARIDLTALRPLRTVVLDAKGLQVAAVRLAAAGGAVAAIDFVNDGATLSALLDGPLAAGDEATIIVDYAVIDPQDGLNFFGPSAQEPDVPSIVWSHGEPQRNSSWFPCFDNPTERQTTEVVATVPSRYQVCSNGRLIEQRAGPTAGTTTWHWLQDKPHAAYLVTLVAGQFEVGRDTWRGKPVEYWVRPDKAEQTARSFRNTIRMLDFFSDAIGVEYPWDRYAQVVCYGFGGGMEHTAATTLGERSLHDERSMLDGDSDGLIAHELAHQWWGDLLTCRDWAHLWLNEGFATYFEALWGEYDLGPDEFACNMLRKAASARGGLALTRPIVDRAYAHPRAMFDSRSYPKGAWVLHMLRRQLGDEQWWAVLNHYATLHAYGTVETVDLRQAVETVTGRSFERFFWDWTERPGHPVVSVAYEWLGDENFAKITVKQTHEGAPFHFPLAIEYDVGGDAAPVRTRHDVTAKETTYYERLDRAPWMVRVDPDFAVLMELEESKGQDLWEAQLLQDPSPIGRIRAAQHFAKSRRGTDCDLLARALAAERFWAVRREIAGALGDAGGNTARDALLAGLAFEDARSRLACVEQLDTFTGDAIVTESLRTIVERGDASYAVEAAAAESFAALRPADGLDVLQLALGRPSRGETIRSGALNGMGRLGDPAAIPLLSECCGPEKPRLARPAAIRALARATRDVNLDEAAWTLVVQTLSAQLDDSGERVRSAAAGAFADLAEPAQARPALPRLRAIAANDPIYRLRESAQASIAAIEKGETAKVQLDDVKKELKELAEQNEELTDRLEKLESRTTPPAAAP